MRRRPTGRPTSSAWRSLRRHHLNARTIWVAPSPYVLRTSCAEPWGLRVEMTPHLRVADRGLSLHQRHAYTSASVSPGPGESALPTPPLLDRPHMQPGCSDSSHVRFVAPPAFQRARVRYPRSCLVRHLPPSGFLTPSTVCSSSTRTGGLVPATLMGFKASASWRPFPVEWR
mgnify:FL=1